MRWKSESSSVWKNRIQEWHRWFAWHPIRIGEEKLWLCFVYRRAESIFCYGTDCYAQWIYQETPP